MKSADTATHLVDIASRFDYMIPYYAQEVERLNSVVDFCMDKINDHLNQPKTNELFVYMGALVSAAVAIGDIAGVGGHHRRSPLSQLRAGLMAIILERPRKESSDELRDSACHEFRTMRERKLRDSFAHHDERVDALVLGITRDSSNKTLDSLLAGKNKFGVAQARKRFAHIIHDIIAMHKDVVMLPYISESNECRVSEVAIMKASLTSICGEVASVRRCLEIAIDYGAGRVVAEAAMTMLAARCELADVVDVESRRKACITYLQSQLTRPRRARPLISGWMAQTKSRYQELLNEG